MTQYQFNQYLSDLDALQRMSQRIQTLPLIWQLEVEKIDLSVLKSFSLTQKKHGSSMRIEWVNILNISSLGQYRPESMFTNEAGRYLDLFKLMESGTKIIPPSIHRSVEVRNGTVMNRFEPQGCISVTDGNHRVALARYCGLPTIPLLVIETPDRYIFDRLQWDISSNGENIELREKNGNNTCYLPIKDFSGTLNMNDQYVFCS